MSPPDNDTTEDVTQALKPKRCGTSCREKKGVTSVFTHTCKQALVYTHMSLASACDLAHMYSLRYMQAGTPVYTHTCKHTYMQASTRMNTHTCKHMYMQTHIHANTRRLQVQPHAHDNSDGGFVHKCLDSSKKKAFRSLE